MNEFLKIVKEFVSAYSMELILFIAGSFGAMIADNNLEIDFTKKQRIVRMLFGGITAVFSTQLVVEIVHSLLGIELTSTAIAGVGFYLGQIGLHGVTKLMLRYTSKAEDK